MRIDSLPYVEATILELLRYKTVIPMSILHRTLKDTEFGGYFVPGKTTVCWVVDQCFSRDLLGETSPQTSKLPQEFSATPAVKLKVMSLLDWHLLLNVSCFNSIK